MKNQFNKFYLEDLLQEKSFSNDFSEMIKKYIIFLSEVSKVLNDLVKNNPEIFRRNSVSRIKNIVSIINKVNSSRKYSQSKKFFDCMYKLDDIAGIRLTIATKDQFGQVEQLLDKSLSRICTAIKLIKPTNKCELKYLSKERNTGENPDILFDEYCANHYVIFCKKNPEIKCEIQIRSLTQDLWAVFSHYESYKKLSTRNDIKDEQLINYSRLMDISDHFAQSIRKEKIKDANLYLFEKYKHDPDHYDNDKSNPVLSVDLIIEILFDTHYYRNSQTKIDYFLIINLMMEFVQNKIYTKSQLKNLINKSNYIKALKEMAKKHNLTLNNIENVKLLLLCYRNNPDYFKANKVTSLTKDYIDVLFRQITFIRLVENQVEEFAAFSK